MTLSRTDFRQLAEVRTVEAAALPATGLWDGAYYLAGYAVECGLKACIMGRVERTGIIFTEKKYAEKCWTHDIEDLLVLAGLKDTRDADSSADPALDGNWATADNWNETARYGRTPEADARRLYTAITDPTHGVLTWIRKHW